MRQPARFTSRQRRMDCQLGFGAHRPGGRHAALRDLVVAFSAVLIAVAIFAPAAFGQFGLSGSGNGGGLFGPPKVQADGVLVAATADRPALLMVRARIEPGWHIYSMTQTGDGPRPTRIELPDTDALRLLGPFQVHPQPDSYREPAFNNIPVESHEGSVVWVAAVEFAPHVSPGNVQIEGTLNAQPCNADSCLPPQDFSFTARLGEPFSVPPAVIDRAVEAARTAGPPSTPEEAAGGTAPPEDAQGESPESGAASDAGILSRAATGDELPWQPYRHSTFLALVGEEFDPTRLQANLQSESGSPWLVLLSKLGLAFLGGIILNIMPCVLPVIGLKVLSFVEQAGENRARAFFLNLSYSLGLLSVFLLLAVLAATLNMGWGHLFRLPAFNVVMAAIVFAMGLSFLGVWEIPIPGFVGSGKAVEMAQKEGFSGAFAKGILTTILATPCTGPYMGAALAWALSQPPAVIFAVFMSVGLGMASPYLLVGAFPRLIAFLPKPGAWMETFKNVMGFVLLGTVVFIFSYMGFTYIVPTLGFLFALWAGCWWIGRAPATASTSQKLRAWGQAAAFVALIWLLMFPGLKSLGVQNAAGLSLHDVMAGRFEKRAQATMTWKLAEEQLKIVPDDGAPPVPPGEYTVMVDATADWCMTCKTLEATVLNTHPVREKLAENKVVLLQADWTDEAPEVTQFLEWLGYKQVPVIAIFPAGRPNEPIVFTGWYQQSDILAALEQAGPSEGPAPKLTKTAQAAP